MVRSQSGETMTAARLLRQPEIRLEALLAEGRIDLEIESVPPSIDIASLETSLKYAGYLRRQEAEIERARRDERRRIPSGFRYENIPGLSREMVQRLTQVRPDTLGQALRIPGVTPAAVAVLASYISRPVHAT
jgi:tRNA uridine 5-carboxymethylaminomethyl modification enzyme